MFEDFFAGVTCRRAIRVDLEEECIVCLFEGTDKSGCFCGYALISLWALLLCSGIGALAQSTAPTLKANPPFSIRATHLLGFPNTKSNCNGTLSVQGQCVAISAKWQARRRGKDRFCAGVFLGEESKQVGGMPMKMGRQRLRSEVAGSSVSLPTKNTTP